MSDFMIKDAIRKNGKSIRMDSFKRTIAWRWKTRNSVKEAAEQSAVTGYRECCPICKHSEWNDVTGCYGFHYVSCARCGHVFYRNVIDQDSIQGIYDGDTSYLNMYVDEALYQLRVDMIANPKVQYVTEIIHPSGGGGDGLMSAVGAARYSSQPKKRDGA